MQKYEHQNGMYLVYIYHFDAECFEISTQRKLLLHNGYAIPVVVDDVNLRFSERITHIKPDQDTYVYNYQRNPFCLMEDW